MAINYRTLQRQLIAHGLGWLGFIGYEQAVFLLSGMSAPSARSVLLNYLLNIALFYLNGVVLLPRLYESRRYGRYALAALGVLATYSLMRSVLYLYVVPALGLGTTPLPATPFTHAGLLAYYWAQSFYRGTFFQVLSTGYWFARRAVQLQVQKRRQEKDLRVAERSLMEANLAFLKNQINPHFLFNSLNFLYAQVYPHSEPAAQGILLLAETMRYALHEEIHGKVMLDQEVKHLHNYIALNQLRFNNQLQVDFAQQGSTHFLRIIPLVLITFVENCFKHGELTDAAHPLRIRLAVVESELTFETYNKKRFGPKEKSTGIGLANTRQRLDLLYPSRYTLSMDNNLDYYSCKLIINL
ncbi:MAG: sensor histidine kinase [Janthinobacterium lividum]